MADLHRRIELAHPARDVYAIVARVGDYAEFLPWLERVEILDEGPQHIDAVLHAAKAALHPHYTTRFELEPPGRVQMRLVEGPMQRLDGAWSFEPLSDTSCLVRLDVAYEFSNPVYGLLFGHTFRHTIEELLDHVAARADEVCG